MKQTGLKRSRKARPPEGPLSRAEWFDEVYKRAGGLCAVTRTRVDRRVIFFACHHPFPKQRLRREKLYDRVWDPRNGVLVQPSVHDAHERAVRRIPYEALPQSVHDFVSELGLWAEDLLLRYHPRGGQASGASSSARGDRTRTR